jgi:hypothetical protein
MVNKMTFKTIKRAIIHFFQRIFRGFDDRETWNLDRTFAKYMAPRLRRFRQLRNTYPPWIESEKWDEYLGLMIDAFEFYSSDAIYDATEQDFAKHVEGLELFAENYNHLWW